MTDLTSRCLWCGAALTFARETGWAHAERRDHRGLPASSSFEQRLHTWASQRYGVAWETHYDWRAMADKFNDWLDYMEAD